MTGSRGLAGALAALVAAPAAAAEGAFHGGALSPLWVITFAGILL